MQTDVQEKLERIRRWLSDRNSSGLLLSSQTSFAWLTGGRGYINLATEQACAKWLVTPERLVLISNNIELLRLKEEEINSLPAECVQYDWYDPQGEQNAIQSYADESGVVLEQEAAADLMRLRQPLTAREQQRYAELGRDLAEALEAACQQVKRGETEWQAATLLARHCLERGIEPLVNLVAADSRTEHFRHPLPTQQPIERYAMLVIGGRRHGLIASATRLVHFGAIQETLRRKHQAVATVDAAMIAHTRPGTCVADIFQIACDLYRELGFPDEWQHHHQGGLTGYVSREYRAHPHSEEVVGVGQAFSWNPTIAGVKSEDTILVKETDTDFLTRSGQFPELAILYNGRTWLRPDILQRQA